MRTKLILSIICIVLAISNVTTYVSFQDIRQSERNSSDYTDFQVYETEFEEIPYLVFVQEGKVVGIVHSPKDYME